MNLIFAILNAQSRKVAQRRNTPWDSEDYCQFCSNSNKIKVLDSIVFYNKNPRKFSWWIANLVLNRGRILLLLLSIKWEIKSKGKILARRTAQKQQIPQNPNVFLVKDSIVLAYLVSFITCFLSLCLTIEQKLWFQTNYRENPTG